jgi:diguanylate cyclase (GGDEF)-like protein/PAS domain S-box-containing protein
MFSVEKIQTWENEKELRLVIDNLPSMIAYVDPSKRYRIINRAYHDYFDANENEVIGKHAREVLGNRFYKNIKKYINIALAGKSTGWETYHSDSTGKGCILSVKLVPYVNSNGNNDGYLVVVEDITKKKQLHLQLEMLNQSLEEKVNSRTRQLQEELLKRKMLEKKLRYLADYDPLTSLLNRRSFTKRVDYEIKRCHRYKSDLSYLIIDIDKFKLINDTYGHLTGDAVLKAFAKKISGILRETDFIGRIGGEEFAVVLPGTGITAADEMGERIRKQIAEHTVQYNNVSINYTVSIGVSVFALKEECMNEAFNRADSALYHAKNTGRNKVCVYT